MSVALLGCQDMIERDFVFLMFKETQIKPPVSERIWISDLANVNIMLNQNAGKFYLTYVLCYQRHMLPWLLQLVTLVTVHNVTLWGARCRRCHSDSHKEQGGQQQHCEGSQFFHCWYGHVMQCRVLIALLNPTTTYEVWTRELHCYCRPVFAKWWCTIAD